VADQSPAQSERPFCPACDLDVNACTCELAEVDDGEDYTNRDFDYKAAIDEDFYG
jgi:hypothetical protein